MRKLSALANYVTQSYMCVYTNENGLQIEMAL